MSTHASPTVVVAGGTGNVGSFIVLGLLEHGATVVVPSRSEANLRDLRTFLAEHDQSATDRLRTFVGDVGDEEAAVEVRERITRDVGAPDAVVASLGRFVSAPSLLEASAADLRQALDGYLLAHFVVARTFLPRMKADGGIYALVNGPLAFDPWPDSGADLVSIATAAQQMLFRALTQEMEESAVRVVELVNHAYIRDRRTQPGSPLPGEAVGAFVARLVSGDVQSIDGRSIHVESTDRLRELTT